MSSSFEGSEIFAASPERILLLINNFESYKEFLPGCLESSKLPDEEEGFVSGRLVFSLLNQTYAFESNNRTAGHEVSITQSKGPFLDFYALWSLEALDENKTKVRFQTTFTLPFTLSIFATQSLINKIGHKFINAFATQLLK
jgi:ribosome-associated toxin RatA of RatAB toxin-antitoxin module